MASKEKPEKRNRKGVGLGNLPKSPEHEEAQNLVAGTDNRCTNSEALEKKKVLMYDYEEGLGHNHQECIKKRRKLWGPRADSPPPSPIPIEVFFPLYPPEFEAELNKERELALQEALSIYELEFKKIFAKMDALEAQKLSSPTPHSVSPRLEVARTEKPTRNGSGD